MNFTYNGISPGEEAMSNRPSWMPSDDPPLARLIFDRDKFRDGEPYPLRIHEAIRLRRLFEIVALKAQIEALNKLATESDERDITFDLSMTLNDLRARLAELETKP